MSVENLDEIIPVVDGLADNKAAVFAYTEQAYQDNDVNGVSQYDFSREQNIPDRNSTDTNAQVLTKGFRSQGASIPRNFLNHFIGRFSYNLNKLVDMFKSFLASYKTDYRKNGFMYNATLQYQVGDVCMDVWTDNTFAFFIRTGNGGSAGVRPMVADGENWTTSEHWICIGSYAKTAQSFALRDKTGKIQVADPTDTLDAANKNYVDTKSTGDAGAVQTNLTAHINATTGVHGATSAANANKIAIRDANGRMQVASPSATGDVANKAYVDNKTWNANAITAGTLPIARGGTGASEVPKALQNLGVHYRLRNAGNMTSKELLLKLSADLVPQVGQAIVISSEYYYVEGSNITFPNPIGVVNTADSTILLVIHKPFLSDDTEATCEGIIYNGNGDKVYRYRATKSKTTIVESGALLAQSLSDLGVTATAAELNKLDGFTGSAAKLNFTNNVTSDIQSQLNGKAKNPGRPGTPIEIEESSIAFSVTPGWYLVELWGGGGGGGAGGSGFNAGGGGGGGGGSYTAVFLYINVSSINVTIGKGGRSNMRSDGDPGDTTSVTIDGIKYTATGGAGGGAGTASARGIGGYGNTFGGTGGESESMGHDGTNAYRNGGGGGQSSGGGGGGGGGGGYENGGEGGEGGRERGGMGYPGLPGAGGGGGGGSTNGEPGIGGKGGDGVVILTPFNA